MSESKVTKAKRVMAKMDASELRQIEKYARDRSRLLSKRAWDAKVAAEWAIVKTYTPGTELWCNATGMFVGGPFQRGDHVKVDAVQPRAKRIWAVSDDGKAWWFSVAEWTRYAFRAEAPAEPLSESDRRIAQRLAPTFERMGQP